MTKLRVLPPSVCGKISGTLKISVDEIFWLKPSPGPTIVEFQWWGDTEINTFTPLDVNDAPSLKHFPESAVTFTIKTTLELFEAYLVNCKKLTFYIVLQKTRERIGRTVIKDISQIINQNDYQCYYPIFDSQGARLGDLHVCFLLNIKNRYSKNKKSSHECHEAGDKKSVAAPTSDKKIVNAPQNSDTKYSDKRNDAKDDMLNEILTKGQSLRKAMVMSVLADCSSDSIDEILTTRNRSPQRRKIGKVDQQLLDYLTGKTMTPEEEEGALNILRNISPSNSVIQLARPSSKPSQECCVHGKGCGHKTQSSFNLSPNKKPDKCESKQPSLEENCDSGRTDYGRTDSDRPSIPLLPVEKSRGREINFFETKTENILRKVDCFRVVFKSVKLSPSGVKKINYIPSQKSGHSKGSLCNTRGTIFLLEYSDSTEFHPEGRAVAKKSCTFLSKKVHYDDITFGQTMTRKLFSPFSCNRIKSSLHPLVIKISWRFLNQRIPLLLGTCIFPEIWELSGLVTSLKLPILTNSALVAGHLFVNVELGSSGKIFGTDLLEKKEDNILCVLNEDGMFEDHCDPLEKKDELNNPEEPVRQHTECCCHRNDNKSHCEETYHQVLTKLQELINSSCGNSPCRHTAGSCEKENEAEAPHECRAKEVSRKKCKHHKRSGSLRDIHVDLKSSHSSSCCYESATSIEGKSFSNFYLPLDAPNQRKFKENSYFPKHVKSTPNINLGHKYNSGGHKSCTSSCHRLPTVQAESCDSSNAVDKRDPETSSNPLYSHEDKYFTHEMTVSIDKICGFPVFADPKIKGEMDCYIDYVFPSVNLHGEVVMENVRSSTEIVVCSEEPKFNYFATHCLTLPSTLNLENGLDKMRRQEIALNIWLRLYQPGPRDHMVAVAFLTVDKLIKLGNDFNRNGGHSTVKEQMNLPIVIVPTQHTSKFEEIKGNYGFVSVNLSYKNYPQINHMTQSYAEKGPKSINFNLPGEESDMKTIFNCPENSDEFTAQSTDNETSNLSVFKDKVKVDVALSPMSPSGFSQDPELKYDLKERFGDSDFQNLSQECFNCDLFLERPLCQTRDMATNTSLEKPIQVEQKPLHQPDDFFSSFVQDVDRKSTLDRKENVIREQSPSFDIQTRFSEVNQSSNRMSAHFENKLQSQPPKPNVNESTPNSFIHQNIQMEKPSPCGLKVARTDVEVSNVSSKALEKLSRSEVFKARVEIERAINIPPILKEEGGCKVLKKPSTCVSFTAFINNVKTELKTDVVHENCNPVWNSSWEVLLPLKLLYIADARLKFEVNSFARPTPSKVDGVDFPGLVGVSPFDKHVGGVEHSLGPSRTQRLPSLQEVLELRHYTVFVDVTVVSAGLPYINGWFSLIQYSRSCGQIKISITPLEDISKCRDLWWKDNCKRKTSKERNTSHLSDCQIVTLNQNKTSDASNQGKIEAKTEKLFTEKVSSDVLAKSLQEKLKELENLTDKIKETFIGMSNAPASPLVKQVKAISVKDKCPIQETASERPSQEKENRFSNEGRDTLSDETLSKVMNISLNHEGSLLDEMLRQDIGNLYTNFPPYSEPQNTQCNTHQAENTAEYHHKLSSTENEELLETASEEIDRIIRNIRYQHENT